MPSFRACVAVSLALNAAMAEETAGAAPEEHERRLQTAAPCAWVSGHCDLNPAYFSEKVAQLPQGSPLRTASSIADPTCMALKDVTACSGNVVCQWNDVSNTCVASGMALIGNNFLASSFDAAACGTSDGANWLKSMAEPTQNPCSGQSQANCAKNAMCGWQSDWSWSASSNACLPSGFCYSKAPYDGSMTFCPAGFNVTKATQDCMGTVSSWEVEACSLKGCPIQLQIHTQTSALSNVCGALTSATTCAGNMQCLWQMSSGKMSCQPNVDSLAIALASVPDSCKTKAYFLQSSSCSRKPQATCAGGGLCEWSSSTSCSSLGVAYTNSGCNLNSAGIQQAIVATTGGSVPMSLVTQAGIACTALTTQAACAAQARPAEGSIRTASGAAGIFQTSCLGAPSFVVAAFLAFAGVRRF